MSLVTSPASRVAYPPPPSSTFSLGALPCHLRLYVGPTLPSRAAGRRAAVAGHVQAVVKRSPKRLKYSTARLKKEDGLFYIEVDPFGGNTWMLEPVIGLLKDGAVGVIPTDTVYAIVCNLKNYSAVDRLRRIKDIEASKPLSILCHTFRDIDAYTLGFPPGNNHGQTSIFRAVKHCLPGPYTFILPASKELPKQCTFYGTVAKCILRKTVGVRIPDDPICQAILEKLDQPLICTSVKSPTEDGWMVDPAIMADMYGEKGLDFIVDGGIRVADPSTIVDMTGNLPTVIRQGKGPTLDWMVSSSDD
ncbi:unnamed protein product [Victoria cruziana]